MEQSFREQRERGQALAILWASFGAIYQRFGYGPASTHVSYEVDPREIAFASGNRDRAAGQVRVMPKDEAARSQFEDPGAALSLLGGTGAALSLCAAGATAIAATVSVRRQWAPLRSALLRLAPTAAAATTPTATTFAAAGTVRTERRRRWSDGARPMKKPSTRFLSLGSLRLKINWPTSE